MHKPPTPNQRAASERQNERRIFMASAGIVVGGALWGFYWVPVRYLSTLGLNGAWAGAAIYLALTVLMLPLIVWRAPALVRNWKSLTVCGLFTGAAFSLYSTSLLMTDVVRAVLLFYLTPIWGTALGLAFLGERLTWARSTALALAVAGLLVVLDPGNMFLQPPNIGDLLALASGMAWALGSFQLYRMGGVALWDQVIAFAIGSLIVAGLTLLSGIGDSQAGAALPALQAAAPVVMGVVLGVALYVMPMLVLTVWPSTLLSPGRVGLLLMSDLIVGVSSAAVFAGEPFGWREVLGSALIVTAAAVEVLAKTPAKALRVDQISSPDR